MKFDINNVYIHASQVGSPDKCTVPSSQVGSLDSTVPSSQVGSPDRCTVPSSQVGSSDKCTVPSSQVGSPDSCTVPSSQVGSSDSTVPSSQVGSPDKCTVPSSQAGSLDSTVPSSQVGSACNSPEYMDITPVSSSNIMPYDVSFDFYYKIGRLASLNKSRNINRGTFPVIKDLKNQNISVKRTDITEDNFSSRLVSLNKKLLCEIKQSKRAHLAAVIECGNFILKNGPIVKTQILCTVFKDAKTSYKGSDVINLKRKLSIELLETLSKYLPVMQIYISGTGYIMEHREGDVQGFVDTIFFAVNQQELSNKNLEITLENFKDYMQFIDTELDKSIVRSILVEIFSINAVSNLKGSTCKRTLRRARDEVPVKIKKFKNLKRDLLSVRNDMTNHQQHCFYHRRISKMKAKAFKSRAKGAGRTKIADQFPQLAEVLELAFGEGSKIHPRLENDTRYKNPNLALTMSQAREILLTAASEKIPNIALSTCYTYTQNFRKNTYQAKRHHFGQDVNAKISLKKLPRVGMMEERANAHYCRAHVNFELEKAASEETDTLVDAKDAKGIVCSDIDPVQNIGKSWLDKTRQDHQFDQSRTNACTPMTHLFLKTISSDAIIQSSNLTVMNVVRTGQPVTLVNISFFEPETVYRCFNELFHLLSIPALDIFFRNQETGNIRKKWIFVVDNGPSEAPASTVERPHASENLALSKHGPFKSAEIFPHKNAKPGTPKHLENMELMAEQVISCLRSAKFGQNQFYCFRGVKDNFIFDDEDDLRNFIKLSEHGKNECAKEFKVVECPLLADISQVWGVNRDFSGSYLEDYNHLSNSLVDNVRTAWLTEYCATVYTKNPEITNRYVKEPLPDFVRWIESNGELHYLCFEARDVIPYGDWDSEELFLPSNVISLLCELCTDIPDSVIDSAALLAWLTPVQLTDEIKKQHDKMEQGLDNDKSRERWKNHDLFKKTVADLQTEAKNAHIIYSAKHTKTDLIQLIAEKKNLKFPNDIDNYQGNLSDIPSDISNLTNLSICELRQILRYHNLNFSGIKDELVMRVFLLRHKRSYMIIESIVSKLSKIAEISVSLIIWQKRY
ncbi:unnamed protein product [Mytilus edulis]|uniref:SAP domain-containing protein n=1 Tax=Mytilus edulis TaxID=6550 RepID=A0A8S3VL88_MYTED|nr:unnamed protein product [Mytilus edulis]